MTWKSIDTAPKEGTKIDLLFPYPHGRAINCFWLPNTTASGGMWVWRTPTWEGGAVLPEDHWMLNGYSFIEPSHWMPVPTPPSAHHEGGSS